MHRFSPLLCVLVISTPLLSQAIFNQKETLDLITITRYCANVEDYSQSQVPRIFAQTASAYGQSAGWVEFANKAAWRRAGSPQPAALVWYRDAKIIRVALSPNEDESPRVYADYCYRPDGTLARLRSVPSERQRCEASRYQCTRILREVRFQRRALPRRLPFIRPGALPQKWCKWDNVRENLFTPIIEEHHSRPVPWHRRHSTVPVPEQKEHSRVRMISLSMTPVPLEGQQTNPVPLHSQQSAMHSVQELYGNTLNSGRTAHCRHLDATCQDYPDAFPFRRLEESAHSFSR